MYALKRTPIQRQILSTPRPIGMYKHVIVRLRHRPGQKIAEVNAIRKEIDDVVNRDFTSEITKIHSHEAPSTFAWEFSQGFDSANDVPYKVKNFLDSWKSVDNYAPAVATTPEANPEDAPSLSNIMDTFKGFADTIPFEDSEAYGLRLYPSRFHPIPVKELSVTIRDQVSEHLEKAKGILAERTPQIKKLLEDRATAEAAEAAAKGLPAPTAKPKLNLVELQLDMFKNIGFWSSQRFHGVGAAKSKEQARQERIAKAANFAPAERIGSRVVIVKIGEIFLKKGNRFKFMLQLQSNIRFKLAGRAHISRRHHFYVIAPMMKAEMDPATGKARLLPAAPFTDEQLREVCDIVRCVPGVENVCVGYNTSNDFNSIQTSMQYMLAAAALTHNMPLTEYTPIHSPSVVGVPAQTKQDILDFLSATKHEDEEHNKRVAAVGTSMAELIKLGFKVEAHAHQPCPYQSRSGLQKDLGEQTRAKIASLMGLDQPLPHPGQVLHEQRMAKGEIDENAPAASWVQPRSGVEIRVEVTVDAAYVYFAHGPDSIEAVGGQPTGTLGETQTVVALLSGGMDSPVAAFSLMRRGMRVVLVHFQNANLADEDTVKHKIVQLAEQLSKYQIITHLHIVPFSAIQDAIIMEVPSPARMLVYRRYMFHVAAKIAYKYSARFLVVGDALGQVASQTSSNLYASYINAPLPLLSPLVGSNKKDIMDIAKRIGTYDISALPYGDCCSYFLAKHPMTKIRPEVLAQYEAAVGKSVEGGARKLVEEAYYASAIVRWHKQGMEVLRELMPVNSHHDNAASKLLLQCPTRPRDDDEMADEEVGDEEFNRRMEEQNALTEKETERLLSTIDAEEEKDVDVEEKVASDLDASPVHTAKKARVLVGEQEKKHTAAAVKEAPVTSAYLDNAATTRLFPAALKAMMPYLSGDLYGNTSSQHGLGITANAAVEEARRVLLGLINAPTSAAKATQRNDAVLVPNAKHVKKQKDQLLVFTSGGTEANNIALIGAVRHAVDAKLAEIKATMTHNITPNSPAGLAAAAINAKPLTLRVHLLTSPLEHSAVLEPVKALKTSPNALLLNGESAQGINTSVNVKVDVTYIKNDQYGFLDVNHLQHVLQRDAETVPEEGTINTLTLATFMHANNEVGVVQPIVAIGDALQAHRDALAVNVPTTPYSAFVGTVPRVLFHSDACQSFGKLHIDVEEAKLDLLTINGHKVHGPKGVGALFVRPGVYIAPITVGGGHEGNIRPGTLNVPGIVGMAAAAAHIHGVETALLDPTLPAHPITVPIVRKVALPGPAATSVGVNNEANVRVAGHIQELRRFIYEHFPRSYVNGPLLVTATEDGKHTVPVPVDAQKRYQTTTLDEYLSAFTTTPQMKLPNVLSIVLDRSTWMDSSAVIKYLSARGVFVSSGSACASNAEPAPSHVLLGMGMRADHANATVRISLGHLTTDAELDFAKKVLIDLAQNMIKNFKPQGR